MGWPVARRRRSWTLPARPACRSRPSRWCCRAARLIRPETVEQRAQGDRRCRLRLQSRRGQSAQGAVQRRRHGHQRSVQPVLSPSSPSASNACSSRPASCRSSPTRPKARCGRRRCSKSLMEQGVAGLIVSPARGTAPDAFRRIETAGIPVVFAMRRLPASRIPAVSPDNHRGADARHRAPDRARATGGSPSSAALPTWPSITSGSAASARPARRTASPPKTSSSSRARPTAAAAWPASTSRSPLRRAADRRTSASTTPSPSAR